MGGKRPDQHNISPGETLSTDYKNRVEDENILEEAKHDYQMTKKQDQESFIPKAGKNPALADLQQKRDAAAAEQKGDDESEG